VEKVSLYTASFKTKSKKPPKLFSQRLLEVIKILQKKKTDEEHLSAKEKKRLMSMLSEPVFESQKRLLPKLLETLKKTRACLVKAKETAMANACLYDLIQIKSYFTENEHNTIEEWETNREKILERFDENIMMLQSRMKCIRGAKQMEDLAVCMKE
jgi:hypothetical protein